MVAEPEVGPVIPVNILIKVVFPAPLCPNIAVIWSSYMVNDNSRRERNEYHNKK